MSTPNFAAMPSTDAAVVVMLAVLAPTVVESAVMFVDMLLIPASVMITRESSADVAVLEAPDYIAQKLQINFSAVNKFQNFAAGAFKFLYRDNCIC